MGCANSSTLGGLVKRSQPIPVSERLPVVERPVVILGHAENFESKETIHCAVQEPSNPVFAPPPDIIIEIEDELEPKKTALRIAEPGVRETALGTAESEVKETALSIVQEQRTSRRVPTLEQPAVLVEQKLPITLVRVGNESEPLDTALARDVPFEMFVQLKNASLLTEVEVLWIPHLENVFHGRLEVCVDDVLVAVGTLGAQTGTNPCSGTPKSQNLPLRCRLLLDEPLDNVQAFTLRVTSSLPGADFLPSAGTLAIKEIVPRGLPIGTARPRRRLHEPPHYWETLEQRIDARVDLRDDQVANKTAIFQRLLDETWTAKATRDRRGGLPERLVVRKVQRIEGLALWNRFSRRRRDMSLAHSGHSCTPVEEMRGGSGSGIRPVRTQRVCEAASDLLGPCQRGVNEHYLFHGTSPAGALGIIQRGFDMSKAGSSTGQMFGPGAYFAEASSKFDEYARPDELSGMCAVLVCRVLCGEMYHALRQLEVNVLADPNFATKYSGVLGDREASVGTYREFVVFSPEQIYPEYLIIYDRQYGSDS